MTENVELLIRNYFSAGDEPDVRADELGGEPESPPAEPEDRFHMTRNFLATDKVPETIFGIPVVSERGQYTDEDIQFFREHPDAGGYYDLGDENGTTGDVLGGSAQGTGESVPQDPGAAPAQEGGPRIVINPSTFRNEKDALCVAFNEAFRIIMETNGFEPQAEPTSAQRRFFADTAYADDEVQLRRTILARICTFDTSIS